MEKVCLADKQCGLCNGDPKFNAKKELFSQLL